MKNKRSLGLAAPTLIGLRVSLQVTSAQGEMFDMKIPIATKVSNLESKRSFSKLRSRKLLSMIFAEKLPYP
ncbi:MAG: hypothetical protein CMF70_05645 [Magnetovibrio sp.]|nr:hypothetical protein [Magnetovibrio sp.]